MKIQSQPQPRHRAGTRARPACSRRIFALFADVVLRAAIGLAVREVLDHLPHLGHLLHLPMGEIAVSLLALFEHME